MQSNKFERCWRDSGREHVSVTRICKSNFNLLAVLVSETSTFPSIAYRWRKAVTPIKKYLHILHIFIHVYVHMCCAKVFIYICTYVCTTNYVFTQSTRISFNTFDVHPQHFADNNIDLILLSLTMYKCLHFATIIATCIGIYTNICICMYIYIFICKKTATALLSNFSVHICICRWLCMQIYIYIHRYVSISMGFIAILTPLV